MKGKYLITTDSWFYAPDGKSYRAVWGEVEVLDDSVLGVKTNRNSTNWYVKIGSRDNHVIIAGCQIHYAIKSPKKPAESTVNDYTIHEGKLHNYSRPSLIYIAN